MDPTPPSQAPKLVRPARPCPCCPRSISDLASHVDPPEPTSSFSGPSLGTRPAKSSKTSSEHTIHTLGQLSASIQQLAVEKEEMARDKADCDHLPEYDEWQGDVLVDASAEQLEKEAKRAEEENEDAPSRSPTPSRRGILRTRSESEVSESADLKKKSVHFHASCEASSGDKYGSVKLDSSSNRGDESGWNGEASDSVKKSKKKVTFKGMDEEEDRDQGPWI